MNQHFPFSMKVSSQILSWCFVARLWFQSALRCQFKSVHKNLFRCVCSPSRCIWLFASSKHEAGQAQIVYNLTVLSYQNYPPLGSTVCFCHPKGHWSARWYSALIEKVADSKFSRSVRLQYCWTRGGKKSFVVTEQQQQSQNPLLLLLLSEDKPAKQHRPALSCGYHSAGVCVRVCAPVFVCVCVKVSQGWRAPLRQALLLSSHCHAEGTSCLHSAVTAEIFTTLFTGHVPILRPCPQTSPLFLYT